MGHFVGSEDVRSVTMSSHLSTVDVFYSLQQSNPSDKGPFQLMQIPTHLLIYTFNTGTKHSWWMVHSLRSTMHSAGDPEA